MQRITDILVDPLLAVVLLVLFFIAVLVSRHAREERNTMGLLFLFVLMTGLSVFVASPAVVNPMLDKLESRFGSTPECAGDYTPLVVLGGGLDSRIRSVGQIEYMSEATLSRVSEALRLVRQQEGLDYPVVLAGGGQPGMTEADVMREFLRLTQMPVQRLVIEPGSATTYTNAQNVATIFEQKKWTRKIRLVTSALHMYRAEGVFRQLGFETCPISVDRQALQDVPRYALLPQTSVLVKSDKLWHEVAGIFYYRLRNWIP